MFIGNFDIFNNTVLLTKPTKSEVSNLKYSLT